MTKTKIVSFSGDKRYSRLLSGVPETRGMKSGYVVLQPGESVGPHTTDEKEEAVIILDGSIQVIVGEDPAGVAERGQIVYIEPHTLHDMVNTGTVPARYVYVVAPVSAEGVC